jgi:hypothetical protein
MHRVPAATQWDNSNVHGVFNCHVCGRQFTEKSYLHRHLRFHAGPKPYICTVCSKRFTNTSNLYRHMVSLHKDVEYTYDPLVNMVCNITPNNEQSSVANQSVPSGQKSISKSSGASLLAPAVATMNNAEPPSPLKPTEPQVIRKDTAGYLQQDILNILRNNQPGPRDVSANIGLDVPTMQFDIPCMVLMEISEMTMREFPNMNTANLQNIPREMSSLLLRELTTMPQDSSSSPQVFIMPC